MVPWIKKIIIIKIVWYLSNAGSETKALKELVESQGCYEGPDGGWSF
jgi:hypothetical protein